ncbi:hypothetical protein OGAPHI_006543 [Ogataea philodendri]|uniref:Rxt3-domain-containing protein n=1 Tax=Ogataea philodendri TaxID=1378263 RepID=A0A9P8NXG6_9ASCO|nr:uncharacterized protein OGAPHI_006543 [Ogataea philodendri]KAH3661693.1 hypothetical protein OGAPHI_006543 [Ogataea philodendri]
MSFNETSYNSQNNRAQVKLPPISFLSGNYENKDKETEKRTAPAANQLPSLSSINSSEFQLPSISSLTPASDSIKLPSIKLSNASESPGDQKPPSWNSASPPARNSNSPSSQQETGPVASQPKDADADKQGHHHHHIHEDLSVQLKEAQQHLKSGGHIHVVHQPHGNHHHHKILIHNPNETPADVVQPQGNDTTIIQNDSTIIDPNATVPQETSLVQAPSPKPAPVETRREFKPREITIDSKETLLLAASFPRKHLGSIIYQEYPTKETRCMYLENIDPVHQQEDFHIPNQLVSKRIELLPAYFANYINCTVDIRIPYKSIPDNINVFDRRIWGTDIYTDDSDIVAILYHCGVLQSADPTGADDNDSTRAPEKSEKSGESEQDKESGAVPFSSHTGAITPGNLDNIHNVSKPDVNPDEANDLVVTLIILPRLGVYQGSYRNHYNSRTWGQNGAYHNGVSIALYGVRWCRLGGSYDGLNTGSFRKRLLNERMEVSQKLLKTSQPNDSVSGWTVDRKFYKEFK